MRILVVSLLLFACTGVWCQQVKWDQPWTPPRGSVESRVQNCQEGILKGTRVRADDFRAVRSSRIIAVDWYGTLSSPNQAFRRYLITIWEDNGNCQPQCKILCQVCVTPQQVQPVGTDCNGATVYRFFAFLSTAGTTCQQREGARYWFSVAEIDQESIRLGLVDFRWSGRRPVQLCKARTLLNNTIGAVNDPCDNLRMDLSFSIYD
jgi:hypothetical protein